MPFPKIQKYLVIWSLKSHVGNINILIGPPDKWVRHVITDPGEFTVVHNLLRTEKPLFYNEAGRTITSGSEPVGEEET